MKKMKKRMSSLLLAVSMLMVMMLAACGSDKPAEPTQEATPTQEASPTADVTQEVPSEASPEPTTEGTVEPKGKLMMATTTSTADTGLLDYLKPLFLEDTGWELEWNAVGTGEALKLGEGGDVDIVLVHAKASEEEFVANGFGVERFPVMYNDFVVVGPKEPIAPNSDISAVFTQIQTDSLPFISRGDDSGTDKKEKKIWETLSLDPKQNANYIESGQGMGATITMADESKAYCLTDRGTWLKQKNTTDLNLELEIICEGDKNLLNQYGVIAVSKDKYPEINTEAAEAFIEWICSADVQKLIGEFGVDTYGQALFTPNAGTDS